ncbi:MAG: phage tail protein [Cyanobacteria bacterium SBLK]|nr:phage tail protein [Cyanobacteria bacterium SBLK]
MPQNASQPYLLLGDLQWQIPTGIEQLNFSNTWNWPEHPRIGSFPQLQPNGKELTKLSLRLKLHCSQGRDPDEEIAKLKEAAEKQEPLDLVWGAGWGNGEYVLKSMEITTRKSDREGKLISAEVALELAGSISDPQPEAKPEDSGIDVNPYIAILPTGTQAIA